jgi:hypothetical protein
MKGRAQIHGYVPTVLRQQLREYAAKKGVSESSVLHAALLRYLGDPDDTPLILRRLNRIERSLERSHRDADIRAEAFAAFVKVWLAHTPRLPDAERGLAERSALQRFTDFLDHVAGRVAEGKSFVADVLREEIADRNELAAAAAQANQGVGTP